MASPHIGLVGGICRLSGVSGMSTQRGTSPRGVPVSTSVEHTAENGKLKCAPRGGLALLLASSSRELLAEIEGVEEQL